MSIVKVVFFTQKRKIHKKMNKYLQYFFWLQLTSFLVVVYKVKEWLLVEETFNKAKHINYKGNPHKEE